MGRYLGSWKLEDVIYVPVQTSAVTTGAAADAETLPTWGMYENNTATPVTTGSFATLNAQVGFYIAAITLASVAGYEKGKSYSLRVQATVNAIVGADVHALQIEAEVDANSVSADVAATVGATAASAIADAVWADTVGAQVSTALPNAAPGASGGLVRVGANSAAVSFTAGMTISNTGGNALSLSSSGGNGHGLAAAGNGSGDGISAIGGGTGHGAQLIGGVTSGDGLHTHGMGTGHGVFAEAHGTGQGIKTAETDAIKAKTDSLTFTVAGQVDANLQSVNDTSITGNGQAGTEWGPGV